MKTLENLTWLFLYLFCLIGYAFFSVIAFMQEVDLLAWPMVLGGGFVMGAIGYRVVMNFVPERFKTSHDE